MSNVINEGELKARRDAVAKALKFINQRVKDQAEFSRQDLFGRDSAGRGTYVQWSRDLTRFLVDEGKIARSNARGIPLYHAVKEVEVSQDSVTRYMKREPEEDDLFSLAVGKSNGAGSSEGKAHVIFEEEDPEPGEPAEAVADADSPNPPAEVAPSRGEVDLALHEMLKALVDILPSVVTAINRIEKKVVAVEKAMALVSKDFTDLLALVEEKK